MTVDRDASLAGLAKQIAILQQEIRSRQEECDRLKSEVRALCAPGIYDAGDLKVTVRKPAGRLDEAKFKAAYPAAQYASLYRVVPDSKAIKRAIAPNDLAKLQKFGDSQVIVA